MRRHVLLLALLSAPAGAAERRVGVSSFDRLRVTGPFEVRVAQGSPSATVSGDPRLAERVEVRVDGTTLTVRMGGEGWGAGDQGGRPASAPGGPVVVTLATPRLSAASAFAGARLRVDRMAGDRVDLSISGAGEVQVADARADEVDATLVGAGALTVAGAARRARLVTNGPGRIDAGHLAADELFVRLDGPGETSAAARFAAQVTNAGLGTVTVAGNPKCDVRSPAGGPVTCGAGAR